MFTVQLAPCKSQCILFYAYHDKVTIAETQRKSAKERKDMSLKGTLTQHDTPQQQQKNLEKHLSIGAAKLHQVLGYAQNKTECRRKLLLTAIGEDTDVTAHQSECCDNCSREAKDNSHDHDIAPVCRAIISIVQELQQLNSHQAHQDNTIDNIVDVYRGSKAKHIVERGYTKLTACNGKTGVQWLSDQMADTQSEYIVPSLLSCNAATAVMQHVTYAH